MHLSPSVRGTSGAPDRRRSNSAAVGFRFLADAGYIESTDLGKFGSVTLPRAEVAELYDGSGSTFKQYSRCRPILPDTTNGEMYFRSHRA
jgi:hypothetical protein